MAEYVKRAAEVFAQVLEFVKWSQADASGAFSARSKTLTPTELDKATDDAAKERDQFLKKTTEYFEQRKGRLDAIIAVVEKIVDDGYSMTGDAESRFRDAIQPLLEDSRRILGSLVDGVSSPSPKALALQLKWQQEEGAFCAGLSGCRVATCFAQIGRMMRSLDDLSQQMDQSWDALASKAYVFNVLADSLVSEMQEDLRDAARKREERDRILAPALKEAAERLRTVVPDLTGANALDLARARVRDAFSSLDRKLDEYGDHNIDLREMLEQNKRSVDAINAARDKTIAWLYTPYRDVQANVQAFRREPTPDITRAKSNECRERLGQWVTGLPGLDGLRADAESLGSALIQALGTRMRDVEVKYQAFEERNRGRFFDTLKSEIEEILLYTSPWKRYFDQIRVVLPPTLDYSKVPDTVDSAIKDPFDAIVSALKSWSRPDKDSERDATIRDLQASKDEFMRGVRDMASRIQAEAERSNRFYWTAEFTELFQRQNMRRALLG